MLKRMETREIKEERRLFWWRWWYNLMVFTTDSRSQEGQEPDLSVYS